MLQIEIFSFACCLCGTSSESGTLVSERAVRMGKKSKRHTAHAGAAKPAAGSLINNKTVCKIVDELWTSERVSYPSLLHDACCLSFNITQPSNVHTYLYSRFDGHIHV